MGAGHDHHAGARHRWRLAVTVGLVGAFFLIELVVALASSSLALLSDAGHMAADVVGLSAALVATRVASRRDTTGRRTYGSYRAEVFASALAVLLMVGVSAYVVVEAVRRIGEPVVVPGRPLLLVGALGLVVNVVAIVLLRGGAQDSLNVRGAYLEVVADAAGSVGVIVAALLIRVTGRPVWDTVVAVAIGVFVAVRAVMLGRQVLAVLGQHVPEGLEPARVTADLAGIGGVADVHDLHVWTLTSGMNVATVHLVSVAGADVERILSDGQTLLRERHAIAHATLQVEPSTGDSCRDTDW
ncbi:cation diffusion facilitator family transporter [Nostocoides sp. HKS02]|uniref:cation diffusion facilitator family transporter n=1 Tax=Nostocoides sp. HKS02 TaxID=1813880 RepID=UPI0012B46BA2|nr:cation diffusion facilitator family transporter [Tetrasphaera sp. HKS02]QGN59026.1 cation diffusion facilitator family transporter [Tetrasphaera sp. HKS02]